MHAKIHMQEMIMLLHTKILHLSSLLLEEWDIEGITTVIVLVGFYVSLFLFLGICLMVSLKGLKQGEVVTTVGGETGLTMRNARFHEPVTVPWKGATTIPALFEQVCMERRDRRFLGTRKVIEIEEVEAIDGSGRRFEKMHLGEYQWETYTQVFNRACDFASGLIANGHHVKRGVAIFADTRAEWFIALQGCLRQKLIVVAVDASFGEDALIHSLNETQVTTLICDSKQLVKIAAIRPKLASVRHVIYFAEEDGGVSNARDMDGLKVSSFNAIEKLGNRHPHDPRLPSKYDVAVVMYTSGSTGLPKGVMMTHGSIIATVAGIMKNGFHLVTSNEVFFAYLPLAHIFELQAEMVMLALGAAIGYGSISTMADTSSKIKEGTKGDASALRPTIMAAVPTILDRVRHEVLRKVEEKGCLAEKLFNFAYKRRLSAVEGSWFGAWGIESWLWNIIVFKKAKSVLGGRIRYIVSGAAPLSTNTQRFFNICFGAPISQAYGLTETCGGGAFSMYYDTTVGRVGPPLPCCLVKLVSWEQGGYLISDKPLPRGEIVIGGYNVYTGYLKKDGKTKEVYKVDENGLRWFYTGDVGQFHPDGCIEIIDRKKNIVKLQHGEYISLGKVEAALISSNYVESIMLYANPFLDYVVALVVPSNSLMERCVKKFGVQYSSIAQLCDQVEAMNEVQDSILKVAKDAKLDKFEIPRKIKLLPDLWTPETGLVTASLKLKREQIKAKFKNELEMLYA